MKYTHLSTIELAEQFGNDEDKAHAQAGWVEDKRTATGVRLPAEAKKDLYALRVRLLNKAELTT